MRPKTKPKYKSRGFQPSDIKISIGTNWSLPGTPAVSWVHVFKNGKYGVHAYKKKFLTGINWRFLKEMARNYRQLTFNMKKRGKDEEEVTDRQFKNRQINSLSWGFLIGLLSKCCPPKKVLVHAHVSCNQKISWCYLYFFLLFLQWWSKV